MQRKQNILHDFLKLEAAGGIILMAAAVVAIILANSPLQGFYQYILEEVDLTIGFSSHDGLSALALQKPLLLWINDGLMAIFFFLVGLEIKREFLDGELSSRDRALLPALLAVGGMVAPAGIYYFFNQNDPELVRGWAIPAATDIAFALGILALVGSRAPVSLKILLTAVAIIDDLLAILIIALFYTESIKLIPLAFAAVAFIGLVIVNRRRTMSMAPYIILGFILWFAVLKSGVHATLAGVLTAFFIPLKCPTDPKHSPLKHMEHHLHPWIAFMVLPIFAFANAGINLDGLSLKDLTNPITIGIAAGLFIGKQLGVFSMLFIAIKTKLAPMPKHTNWVQLYAVSLLCGVGFTMSLFIGELAFHTRDQAAFVRMGVLMGSLLSAVSGYLLLRYYPRSR